MSSCLLVRLWCLLFFERNTACGQSTRRRGAGSFRKLRFLQLLAQGKHRAVLVSQGVLWGAKKKAAPAWAGAALTYHGLMHSRPLDIPLRPTGLVHQTPEPQLLKELQLSAWAGFRVGLFDAISYETKKRSESPFAVLASILKGRTRTSLNSRGESCDFSPSQDSVGLFGPVLDVAYSKWVCAPGTERLIIELDFDGLAAEGDLAALLPARRTLRQNLTLRDSQLASLMRLMAAEVRQGSPHGRMYATSLSLSLAAYVATHHAEGGRAPQRERGTLTAVQKSCVTDCVQQRLGEDLDLAELARAAGVSRFHFLRLFKNTFGTTPYRFVLDQRLAAARHLLEDTAQPIAEIALATGFSSQSHLSTAMRRRTGLPPGAWRKAVPCG
jgi:AraC family transcriptional regulator